MKTLCTGTGLLFAGLLVIGALLLRFDIPPSQLMHFMNESTAGIKIFSTAGLVITAAGGLMLIAGLVSENGQE